MGSGVTISNVTYIGATAVSGYLTGGSALGLDIDTGILRTSGYASNVDGLANTSGSITGDNGLAGDSDLDSLIPGYSTYDATVLGFDFVSAGDAAYFSYLFGSEEYNEWVGSAFNDVFGFFFERNNTALIPGTTTPVSINNINNGSYDTLYNDFGPTFEHDGFTDAFTANRLGLTPGDTYHIKLAIADAGDHVLDPGVFIQAGTPTQSAH